MQYLPGDLAQLQVDNEDIKRRQQMAQAFQQAGFNPVQGGNQALSLLASVMSTLRGNSMMKDSSKSLSENLAKQFEAQNQADQAKADAERARRDEDYQRDLQKLDYGNASAAKYRDPGNIDPNSPQGIAARLQFEQGKAGMRPKAGTAPPAYQKQIDAAKALGIELSPEDLKQLVTGIKPDKAAITADKPAEKDPKAAAASQARELLKKLKASIEGGGVPTGPVDQFMPGKAGQEFNSTVSQLTQPFQALTKIPGNGTQSDADLKALMSGLPSLGKYEDVNKASIESLISYIDKLSPPEQADAVPEGTIQTNQKTGQKRVMQGGQWSPL